MGPARLVSCVQRQRARLLWSIFGTSDAVCACSCHLTSEVLTWCCAIDVRTTFDSMTWTHVWSFPAFRHPVATVQRASVTTEVISATLNAGQAIILSVGLTAALCLAARGGASAAGMVVTAGDLVSVQCVLLLLSPSPQQLPGCMPMLRTGFAVEAWPVQI